MIQDDMFKNEESNRYHRRRLVSVRDDQQRLRDDLLVEIIRKHKISFSSAAEIGAYNGFRLNYLRQAYGCAATAYEPSVEAIDDGMQRYPGVRFIRGVASQIDAADDAYDLVMVAFVLHWVDRKTIMRSIAEIDRVLKDGGYLIVSDFDVSYPQKRRYHHVENESIWTYKQHYWKMFESSNCYQLIDCTTKPADDVDPIPRSCALLKKNLQGLYVVE